MLSNRLYKFTTKVVLTSYLTQLLTPVIYACELETRIERSWGNSLRDPSPPREKALQHNFQQALNLKPHIESLNSPANLSDLVLDEDQARLQAESFQYRLKVKAKGVLAEDVKLKLSRRTKGIEGFFENLYTSLISQKTLASWTSQSHHHTDDVLMNLLKGASVYKASYLKDTAGFGWMIPGFATLGVTSEGRVVLKQDHASTLLSHYDLVLKTSQNLSLDYLKVASLTLDVPTTQIIGSVSVGQLHIPNSSQTVANEGGLHLKQVTGQGTLINHALLKLEGTKSDSALLGIRSFSNKKSKDKPLLKPIMEVSHLHITKDNQSFINDENAEFKVEEGTLLVDSPSEGGADIPSVASFINKGLINLRQGTIHREAINHGSWQSHQLNALGKSFINKDHDDLNGSATLTILDELNVLALINEGDIAAKNLLKVDKGVNKGTIKGESLFLKTRQNFKNEGDMFLKAITGTGTFYNDNSLKFSTPSGKHGSIDVASFMNGGNTQAKSRAKITGEHVCIGDRSYEFMNDADISVGRLNIANQCSKKTETRFINRGHIDSQTIEVDSGSYQCILENAGTIKTTRTQLAGEKFNFINTPTGSLTTNILTSRASNLDNQGEIQAHQISLRHGQNTGKIYGDTLDFTIQESVINRGEVAARDLLGAGTFMNQGKLQFTGMPEAPSKISVKSFENGLDTLSTTNTENPTAQVRGDNITVSPANEKFVTHDNSEIVAKKLILENPTAPSSIPLELKGSIHTDILDIYRQETVNSGAVSATELSVHGNKFLNATKATLDIVKSAKPDVASFQNDGEMVIEKGQYAQNSGEFINNGLWSHTGDIFLGITTLKNEKAGTLNWQKGRWNFSPTNTYVNHGNWSLDNITCSLPLSITNHGDLHLKNGSLTFDDLLNHNLIIFYNGAYFFKKSLINKNIMRFLNHDWKLGDVGKNYSHIKMELGEIECEKGWVHNVQVLPKAIRAQGNVTFSKTHQQGRSLEDLTKVSSNGKVTFYAPAITTTRDYEFSNIGHLDLYVDGIFTNPFSFKAKSLFLEANGALTNGASNTVMGTIAATEGILTLKAHNIDNRFGKISGAGPTLLVASKGNIINGSAISKGPYLYGMNGSVIASGSTLDIQTLQEFQNSYGKVLSYKRLLLKALAKLINTAGEIFSLSDLYIETPNFSNTRDALYTQSVGNWSWAYSGCYNYCESSDQAIMQSLESIYFSVDQGTNLASSILASKDIFYKPLSQGSFTSQKPSLFSSEGRVNWAYGCNDKVGYQRSCSPCSSYSSTLLSGQSIEISTDNVILSGTANSPLIKIEVPGSALFYNSGRTRKYVDTTQTFYINVTKFFENKARTDPILQITANNEIQTEFPFGRPYMEEIGGRRRVMFVTPENQHLYQIPLDPSRIINPLGSLSGEFLNLYIQSQLSELIGKVEIKGANGNNLKAFATHTDKFVEETGKALITQEDIQKASLARSMLLYGLEKVGNMIHQQMILCITPQDINDVAGLSGDSIRIHAGGNISFQNYEVVAENDIDLFAKGDLNILSVLRRVFTDDGYQDVIDGPTTKIISKKGNIKAVGKNGFQMRGATLRGLYKVLAGSTEGNTSIENVLLEKAVITKEKEDGGLFGDDKVTTTTHITTTSQPSFIESVKTVVEVLCGNKDKTTITGSHLKALQAIKFTGGKVESNASVGVNKFTQHTQQDGAFSSKESISSQEFATLYPTLLEALELYGNTEQATYRGTDFIADVFYDNTKDGASFGPTVATLKYFQQVVSESPLAKSDVGCEGWYEVMQPCRLMINKIVRNIDEGEIKLESVDWDKDRTQIIGKFAETVYELKRHHREWAEITQVIPNEALVVVALAITIATQGTGGKMFAAAVSNMTGGTMVATATGMSMASAAFTTVSTQAATSFLSHGDLTRTGKELFSSQGMRSLGTAIETAGLISDGGSMADLSFGQRLAVNGFRNFVKAGVSSAIENRNIGDTLKEGGISTLVDSISGSLAKNIGEAAASKTNPLTQFEHKAAHFGIGAAMGAVLDRNHPLTGAVTGGMGAMMAEVVAETLVDRQQIQNEVMQDLGLEKGRPLSRDEKIAYEATYREKLQPAMNTAKLVVASVMASLGHDPSIAIAAASNALENNFAGTPYPELMDPDVAEVLPDATAAVGKSILDIGIDMYENPDPYVEAAVLDATPYGDIAHRYYMGETISGLDLAVESIFVVSGTNYVKAGSKTVLKVGKRFGSQFIKWLEDAKNLRKLERARSLRKTSNVEALDLAGASLIGNKRIDGRLFQEHHIISNKHKVTKNHDLLELAGFDTESRTNRMLLPTKKGVEVSTTKRSIHDGRHIDLVSERLAQKMERAVEIGKELGWGQEQYHTKLMKIISEERSALKSGDRILNKNHRPFATDSGRVAAKETIQ